MHDITNNKCKSKPFLEREVLLKKFVFEVVVSSVTSLDNNICLPVAVHYAPKSGKSGDNVRCTFSQQIRLIHMCENCIRKTEGINLILQKNKYQVCQSYCTCSFNSETVCKRRSIKSQTEANPCLRACDYCLQNNFRCIRRAVLVITVDCGPGNK